ncbi:hypothetical protein ACLHZU_15950, partial [Aeromonas salmonicida]|uniref:hypothetical protein n=1 Tax=Aeromonas salmonicida TaxID=645 RepID=UPI003D02AF82
ENLSRLVQTNAFHFLRVEDIHSHRRLHSLRRLQRQMCITSRSSHSYISKPEDLRDFFFYEGDKCDNDFVNEDLNRSKNALHDALLKFEDFKSKHFFVHGPNRANGNLYLCMRPEWNIDRGGNPSSEEEGRYCELSSQLSSLGRELLKAYDEYRTAVKKVLSI